MKIRSSFIVVTLLIGLISGCATTQKQSSVMNQLYDGRPVNSLKVADAPKTEQEAIERGDVAMRAQNYDLALFEYIRSLEFKPAQYRDKTFYTIGRIHQMRENYTLSEKAYYMALKENPNNIEVLQQLGTNYSKQGDLEQGKSFFIRAINADQLRLNSRYTLPRETKDVETVNALSLDDKSPISAYMGLGIIYDMKSSHTVAQAFYKRALKIQPKSSKLLLNIGYSYYMSGDYTEAKRATLAALEIDPNNLRAQNNLALIYLGHGKIQRALNVFMQQMKDYEALNNVGYFLLIEGHPDKAIPYLQQAIDKKPSYYKAANENLERALAEVKAQASQ
ncbi:tetratricopeptide repeat protein [Vibrio mangrovi]|uniref:Photosystem I assembly protein Ycf3 n=1 Tax=Vibrio mangrovi TaxID=474394 RepID=A0A1Y6IYQ8_9VIBR|nr:tetratricopeptide repeat protein [Vibrio mangrovi]MDW6002345.1 tetratricopeptide repeat protein [Vibrio mangrovi]SMS02756.1 photosystem I assembly protein Ycf3 [Vibrio mangrovi]